MKRVVATAPAAQAAAKDVHATPRTDRKPRRLNAAGGCAGAPAAGLAGAGEAGAETFGAAGAGGVAPWAGGCAGVVFFESSVKPRPCS